VTEDLYTCEFEDDLPPNVITKIENVAGTHNPVTNDESNVKAFSLVNNTLTLFPTGLDTEFPALVGIKFQNTPLEFISNNDLKLLVDLKYIGITNAKLQFLPTDVFKLNINLEVVDLSGNPIQFIEGNIFATIVAATVKFIDLSEFPCELDQVTASDSSAFTALKSELQSGKCTAALIKEQIEELESASGKLITQLSNCTATRDTFKTENDQCLQANAKCLKDLEEKTDLMTPANGTCKFMNFENLYTCIANDISILSTADQVKVWSGTHKVGQSDSKVLSLVIKDLNVKLLPKNVTTTFTALNTLIVDKTGLSSISKADLAGYNNLVKMVITSNNIESIEASSFDGLTKVEVLNLSGNKIQALPLKFFDKMTALAYLDISSNDITQLRYDLVPAKNSIEEFYANGINLKSFDYSLVYRLKKADIIEFSGLVCNQTKTRTNSFISFFNRILDDC
jgi:Leucine-rich repeat (LRR) protein